MGTTAEKLQAALDSKNAVQTALEEQGVEVTDDFSTYAALISTELTNRETVENHINDESVHFTEAEREKLSGIATGANAYTLPTATSSTLGGVKTGNNITNSSGTISLTKSNVTSALGYTPPTTNTIQFLFICRTHKSSFGNRGFIVSGICGGWSVSKC